MKTLTEELLSAALTQHVKHDGVRLGLNYVDCPACRKHFGAHMGRGCLYLSDTRYTWHDPNPITSLTDERLR